jgi:outer membrane protein assembly factor BamB
VYADDWAHWRGPHQNGVAFDKNLPESFSLDAKKANSNLIWSMPFGCRSTPVIVNNRVYVINSVGKDVLEGERVMCLDADTGKVLWERRFNVFHADIVSNRVGWTNPAADPETGNVYIHGTQGFLRCYDKDGNMVWGRSLTEEFGRVTGYGGRIPSPIVDGDLVIIGNVIGSWGDFTRGMNRFTAFDKRTGQIVWWSNPTTEMKGTYYSTPVVATINGQRLLITGAADGAVHAIQVRTGKPVWSYMFSKTVINSSPVVDGNYVYISHGEENLDTSEQGRLLCLDGGNVENGHPKLVWEKTGQKFGYTTPVVAEGRVYIANDSGRLFTFDSKTGAQIGRPHVFGRLSRGSPLFADGKIFVFDVNGHFHILKPGKKDIEELHDQGFRSETGGFVETNGTPIAYKGRLYFGTLEAVYCVGKKDGAAGKAPPLSQEESAPGSVATLALFPADVVLHPGGNATFEVRAFDALGVAVKAPPGEGEWSIALPPKQPNGRQPPALVADLAGKGLSGKLTVSPKLLGQQGYVEYKVGSIVGRARIRVAPTLPYTANFENVPESAAPGGWINCMGKYAVVEKDGSKVLKKLAENPAPPVAKARAYIGLPDMKDYTIQADVCGTMVRDNMPDIGLINCRYRLVLDGKRDVADGKRRLRILSWEARPRINQAAVFDWQPNHWYTLKLDIEQKETAAIVRGKVWPRGQPEPKEWTVEFEDPFPITNGAPGIYGYATGILDGQPGAEAFFDNIIVSVKK